MGKWALAGRFIGIGWYFGFCIFLGIWGGLKLDEHFNTSIIFTLVGLFLGLTMAFLGAYRMIAPLLKERQGKGKS